ncbi:hypothetical protein [Streptomyces uncialis]|uniref:hypothetical protein n=1 Tax=Streptomyces uncialis TaxID=1048205 RepID=UPI0033D15BB0
MSSIIAEPSTFTADPVAEFELAAASAARVTRALLEMASGEGLPEPSDVRLEVLSAGARVTVQTEPDDLAAWADRLGGVIETHLRTGPTPGGYRHWGAKVDVAGVSVDLCACAWLDAAEFAAAAAAEAVAS